MLLRDRILKTIERLESVDQRKLAHVARVNESSISRYLNGHDELNFESTLRIVQFLFPEEEKEIMVDYIYSQKSRNARHGLEYCVMNHLWEPVDHLLKLLSESSNPVDKEWATFYDIVRVMYGNKFTPMELLEKVEVLKPKEVEMKVLKSIIKTYLYYDLKEYSSLGIHITNIEGLIAKFKNEFIKASFNVRLGLIMTFVCLYANKVEESRKYSQAIIDQVFFEKPKATAYQYLGHSYILEDYDKSSTYFTKAINLFLSQSQDSGIKTTRLNLSFLNSYWRKDTEFTIDINDDRSLNNYIYHLIRKRELYLAKEYMEKVKVEALSKSAKAFYYYYHGLLTGSVSSFYLSVEFFLQIQDQFHLQLPLKELMELGENKIVLRILSAIRGVSYEESSENAIS